jgi:autotransporter-associated beta strand protein
MKNAMPPLKALALLAGVLLLTHTVSAASKTWTVGGTDFNWSTLNNWSPLNPPVTGDNAKFSLAGALPYAANFIIGTNNVVDFAYTAKPNSLAFNQTNCAHGTLITGSGLVVSGTAALPNVLTVGSGIDNMGLAALDLVTIGGTSLTISNPSSPIVIGETGQSSQGNRRATLNMAALNNFSAYVQRLSIAYDPQGLAAQRRPSATLYLAKTNYITCTASGTAGPGGNGGIGYILAEVVQQAGNASTNRLGQVNVFNVNAMKFGGAKTANTYVTFNSGLSSPSVKFRDAAGVGRSTWLIADSSTTAGSSSGCSAILNFTGGTVDALLDRVYIGVGQAGNNAYYVGGNGTLTYDLGTIDLNTLELGYQYAVGSSAGRGILNVNGAAASLNVNQDIRLARTLGPVTGSSLVTNSIGNLNLNAGTARVYGNIVDGGGNSILTITNNGTLDMKPTGDTVAGNVGVRTLNIGAGAITNYGTLNVSNLNVLSPRSEFVVYPGQTLGVIGAGLAGTATVNSNLTLTNATLALDLGAPGGADDQLAVLANLSLQGNNSVAITPLTGFGSGTYPVITYGALNGDVATNLKIVGAIPDSRYTAYFDTTTAANTITLNVSGATAYLTWSGDGLGNVWNLHQAQNWSDGGAANNAQFYNLDTVTFDDSGSASPAINLVGSLLPTSVAISGTKSYTFGGSGKISGPANLNYSSTGKMTLLATNDYSGGTVINAGGSVQVGNGTTADGAIGTGGIDNYGELIFNSASLQSVPGIIGGNGSIIKRGPGVTVLSGANTFSAGVTNEAGTLIAGNGSAFGDTAYETTINSGATLDLGGQDIGAEPVFVSGTGVGGAGAIVNSGVTAGALNSLTLLGPTTFGGSSMWGVGAGLTLQGLQANSNKITKVGPNLVQVSRGDASAISDPGLGDLEILGGTFSFYGYVGLGDPSKTIIVRSNATLRLDVTGDSLTMKNIVMDAGSTLYSALPNRLMPQYATVPGPIKLGGAVTFNVVGSDMLNLQGEISGAGPVNVVNAGLLQLGASNSFTGDLSIQAGTVALTNEASVTKAANIVLLGTTVDVSGRIDGTLTLGAGQTLKGSGTIVGNLDSPSGTTVIPGASVGAITVTGNATLRGTNVMEMSKVSAIYSADLLAVAGTLDLGGTLKLIYSGDNLQTGDTFQLFTAGSFANAFASVTLPVVPGVTWTNMTAIDGTVRVLYAAPPSAPYVTGVTMPPGGDLQFQFSGPSGYGYSVHASTNVALPAGDWPVVGFGTFGTGPSSFIDLNTPLYPNRFYMITIP